MKKSCTKKMIITLIFFIFIFSYINFFSADDWPAFNVCCEKTNSGAWCQNSKEENCNSDFRRTPTSCDGSSFCKLGCCVDSDEGLCMKNTPQKVCEISKGNWIDDEKCNVAQCDLGCCILGYQASFVTSTRCKRISRLYGLETNFKNDINNEAECILTAHAQDKGACVFEFDGEKTCKLTNRGNCKGAGEDNSSEIKFFKDYLCSADRFPDGSTSNCGPTKETICVEGLDEVYFKDTCGNPANIYDANRIYSMDPSYWQKIFYKSESCGANSGNINSKSCGNCDYLRGSICGKGDAVEGDYVCKDLNCKKTKNGGSYRNGESWCEYLGENGDGLDPAGSRHFRHICIQGEEIIEPCADFRNDICIEDKFDSNYGNFREAACRVNRWTDCIDQFSEKECLNSDKRDCFWIKGVHYDASKSDEETKSLAEQDLESNNKGILKGGFICLPKTPPGLEFWASGNAKSVCSLGNSKQIVKFNTDLFGNKVCKENCGVLEKSWVDTMNKACISLGDCGAYVNFIGVYTDEGILWKQNGKRKNIQTGLLENFEEEDKKTSKKDTNIREEDADKAINTARRFSASSSGSINGNSGDTKVVTD